MARKGRTAAEIVAAGRNGKPRNTAPQKPPRTVQKPKPPASENPEDKPLSKLELAFVAEFLIHQNGSKAARDAGYSKRTSNKIACVLRKRPHVAAAIERGMKEKLERAGMTADEVFHSLSNLARSNILDYYKVDKDGLPYLDLREVSREQADSVQEIIVTRTTIGSGRTREQKVTTRLKLYDKKGALVDVGRQFGLFKEHLEVTGKNGGPIRKHIKVSFVKAKQAGG